MVDVGTLIADLLKVRYPEPEIQDHIYRQQAILPYMKKIMRKAGGKNFSFAIQTQALETTRFNAEHSTGTTGAMKTPAGPEYEMGYDNLKTVYTRQNTSQEALDDSADNAGALASMITRIPMEISEQHAWRIALHAWLDSGVFLATCAANTGDTNHPTLATNSNMRRFMEGMKIDGRNGTTGALATAGTDNFDSVRVLYTVDDSFELYLNTTDVATGVQTAATDKICIEDELTSGSSAYTSLCPNSIPTMVGTGTCHSINTTTYPAYKSIVKTSCGTLTRNKIQDVIDSINSKSKKKLDCIITSPEVVQEYADILIQDIRYTPGDLNKMVGGYPTSIFFNSPSQGSIPVIADSLAPLDEMYFINWEAFRIFASAWLKWLNQGGANFHYIAGYLAWDIVFYSRYQWVCVHRKGLGKITGITVTANP